MRKLIVVIVLLSIIMVMGILPANATNEVEIVGVDGFANSCSQSSNIAGFSVRFNVAGDVTVRSQAYSDFLDDTAVVGPTAGGGAIVQFTMNAEDLPENTVVQYTISNGDPDNAVYVSVNCTTGQVFLQRLLGYDGRLFAGEDLPVVIYPNVDRNGNPFLEFYTFYQPNRSRLTLRVDADDIAGLPLNPSRVIEVGTTRDGLATLYYLPSGEFQVNYAPNDEGKIYVVIFDAISPTGIQRANYPQ